MKNVSTVSITEWGPKTISNDIKNIGNCTFPYPSVPWTNPWKDLTIGSPVEPSIFDWIDTRTAVSSGLRKKEVKMSTEKSKLDRIKGLIEGFQLALGAMNRQDGDLLNGTDLLEKILQVIEE